MNYLNEVDFFGNKGPQQLTARYGSPLFVYSERLLRERCSEMKNLIRYPKFVANYSTKANSNLELLKIIRSEGFHADAMSPGELHLLKTAGFKTHQMINISNNVSSEEMAFAVKNRCLISVDSVSQLRRLGSEHPGIDVMIRFNPGMGAGHHKKVVTAGTQTKFGVSIVEIPDVKRILSSCRLKLVGINMHIGSLFMDPEIYVPPVKSLLAIAERFPTLELIDFGGGFGVPYHKHQGEKRLDITALGKKLDGVIAEFVGRTGYRGAFMVEPGRYISAESGVLLGTVHAIKELYGTRYIGTDLGFNVIHRPVLYNSHHDIEVIPHRVRDLSERAEVTVVGNICETGDIIAQNRRLAVIEENDTLAVLDTGAYCYTMCSNYNQRLKPAEVLIDLHGKDRLIRRRESVDDLMRLYEGLAA